MPFLYVCIYIYSKDAKSFLGFESAKNNIHFVPNQKITRMQLLYFFIFAFFVIIILALVTKSLDTPALARSGVYRNLSVFQFPLSFVILYV